MIKGLRCGAAPLALATALTVIGATDGAAAGTKHPVRSATAAHAGVRAATRRDSVLARVGRDVITRGMVQRRIDELPEPYRANYATPDGRRQFVDRLIEERTWLLAARKHGVDTRPEVRKQIEQAQRDLVIRTYVNEVMATSAAPGDSEAHVQYDAHVADYKVAGSITMSHVLVKSESEAQRIRSWAKGGQDWTKLVARFSTDSLTRAKSGQLGAVGHDGQFMAIGPQPALAESAFALASQPAPRGGVGAIGGPWKTNRGWHVVRIDAYRPETTRPFDQVRSVILRQLAQTHNQDFYKGQLAAAKASLGVSVDSTAVNDFVSQKKTAQDLFKEGQEAGPPAARIAAYQHLLEEYPTSNVSPQAQFMVGFIYSEELKEYDQAEKAFKALLEHYPKSELADSARWMIAHMRTDEAPSFMNLEADSSSRPAQPGGARRPSGKP